MERGVLAIFGGISEKSVKAVQSFVNYHQIPFITWNNPSYEDLERENDYDVYSYNVEYNKDPIIFRNDEFDYQEQTGNAIKQQTFNNTNYLINMHPDISAVLVSLIKYNRHKTIYYLYNHEAGKLS